MRKLIVVFIMLCSCGYGADKVTLQQQLDSIEKGSEAKAKLIKGVRLIQQWAKKDTDTARVHVEKVSESMIVYWGADSAEILKNRLNGMISKVNGKPTWGGTTKRFYALKDELIKPKQTLIDTAANPVAPTPKAGGGRLKKLKQAKTKKMKDYFKVVSALSKLKETDLRAKEKIEKIVDTDIYPYMWSFQVVLKNMKPYRIKDKTHGVQLSCYSKDPLLETQLTFYTLSEALPAKLERGQTLWITGYFGEPARNFAGRILERGRMVGKKVVKYKLIRNSAHNIVSPEFIENAPVEILEKLYLEGK